MSVEDLARLTLRQARRLVIFVVGGTIVLAGLVMLVTPGPGVLVIFLGLGLLAVEFAWAARLLRRAKNMASDVADRVRGSAGKGEPRGGGAGSEVSNTEGSSSGTRSADVPQKKS